MAMENLSEQLRLSPNYRHATAIVLYERGFHQELPVILRIVPECTTQIDFVIAGIEPAGTLGPKQSELVTEFFAD